MATEPFTSIGRLVSSHGLTGELSFDPERPDILDALVGLTAWVVPPPAAGGLTRVLGFRPGPKGPLVSLDGFDSIDRARAVTGSELLVRTEELPGDWIPAPIKDMVGFAVMDAVHGSLGAVVEVIETGANDVWVVHGDRGEVLIPVIADVVREIDDDARLAHVELLDGLLPGNGES